MKNYVQDGDRITATAGATITAGQLVVIGSLFGVAQDSVASGAQYTAALEGVFTLAKATGAGTGPAQGAPVYRISASNLVTAASSGNTLCGYAFAAAADGASTVQVRLLG